MIVSLHFNWLPENALNLAYQVWLPDVDINFLDIKIDTATTTKRKKVRRRKERKTQNELAIDEVIFVIGHHIPMQQIEELLKSCFIFVEY